MSILPSEKMRGFVICLECGLSMSILTKHHMRTAHDLTREKYLIRHPEQNEGVFWGSLISRAQKIREQRRKT